MSSWRNIVFQSVCKLAGVPAVYVSAYDFCESVLFLIKSRLLKIIIKHEREVKKRRRSKLKTGSTVKTSQYRYNNMLYLGSSVMGVKRFHYVGFPTRRLVGGAKLATLTPV